jgi:hypothetical protein
MNRSSFTFKHPVRVALILNAVLSLPLLFLVSELRNRIIVIGVGSGLAWLSVGLGLAAELPIALWWFHLVRVALVVQAALLFVSRGARRFPNLRLDPRALELIDRVMFIPVAVILLAGGVVAAVGWWRYARRHNSARLPDELQ